MLLHNHQPPAEEIPETRDRLHRMLSSPAIPSLLPTLADGASLIHATKERWDASDDASFAALEAVVQAGWCAVVVMGGPWCSALELNRNLRKPFGLLCKDPRSPRPHHAIVLTKWSANSIVVFDPWYETLSHPILIKAAWLRGAWTGELVYYPRP